MQIKLFIISGGGSVVNINGLPHLSKTVIQGIEGLKFDSYLIALEAWRRGLNVHWLSHPGQNFLNYRRERKNFVGLIYTISSSERSHNFYMSWGDKNSYEAYENTQDKAKAKELLEKAGINVPKGKAFYEASKNAEIIEYANSLGYPLVLKPTDQGKGRGVITNINKEQYLKHSLNFVRHEQGYKDIIIEEYITGKEYRLYVIGDKVVSGVYRKPPNVVGDGVNTIETLIKEKNKIRLKNPHIRKLSNPYIKVDEIAEKYLQKSNYTLTDVPKAGELVYLRNKGNFSEGSDSIDVTDTLSPGIKEAAVKALKAIPGLSHGGIDLIYNDAQGTNIQESFVLIEFNASAVIGSHVFPLEGKSRDIPAAIIDYYFPETIGLDKTEAYFDFKSILSPLRCGSASKIELAAAPNGKVLHKKIYHIQDNNSILKNNAYRLTIRRNALDMGLHGYAKKLIDGSIEVLVAGTNEDDVNSFKQVLQSLFEEEDSIIIKTSEYDEPVKVGFYLSLPVNPKKIVNKYMGLHTKYSKIKQFAIWNYARKMIKPLLRSFM